MHKKPQKLSSDKLNLKPHHIVAKRAGRHLKIHMDTPAINTTLKNYYTPLRIFQLSRHTFKFQHLLYMTAQDLSITYKAPEILRKAKTLKPGQEYYMW